MTNAPADLLALRSSLMLITGLDAVSIGIVGDSAHAATGGYHEGKSDLINAGVWSTDYSVRLTRDRNACTESASAVDIGYDWPNGGNAAWLKFNEYLVSDLHLGLDAALYAPIRAVNYTLNGSTKLRTDREAGWSVVSSTDSVDVHTHIEFYRDGEGTVARAECLKRLEDLARGAVAGIYPIAVPAVKKVEDDGNMQTVQIPADGTAVVIGYPYASGDEQWLSLMADTGPKGGTKAAFRVAAHVATAGREGWAVVADPIVIDSQDKARHDIKLPVGTDRASVHRVPSAEGAVQGDAVGAALVWWVEA